MDLGAIVLAGGKSSRMGKDKSLLKFGKKSLVETVIENIISFGLNDILLVTNNPQKYEFLDIEKVKDHYPGLGPLAGIHAGLMSAKHNKNLVIACDMPFVSKKYVVDLYEEIKEYDALIPRSGDKYQPLAAIYTKNCLKHIESLLDKKKTKVIQLFELIRAGYIEMEINHKSFINLNTPEDFAFAQKYINKNNIQ